MDTIIMMKMRNVFKYVAIVELQRSEATLRYTRVLYCTWAQKHVLVAHHVYSKTPLIPHLKIRPRFSVF